MKSYKITIKRDIEKDKKESYSINFPEWENGNISLKEVIRLLKEHEK